MAKLTDLPPETLLTITSFIWSGLPAKKRLFDASISKEKHALAKSLNREGLSVINLARTCKYLHRVLAAEKYRFVSIPRCNSAQKLLSLLRLIRIRPEIGDHVQQLRLQLSVLPYSHTSVSYEQLRSLKVWAATIGINITNITLEDAKAYDNRDAFDLQKAVRSVRHSSPPGEVYHDRECLGIICNMLFHYLRNVEEITFSTSPEIFGSVVNQFLASRPNAMRNSMATNRLPALRSLAIESELPPLCQPDLVDFYDIGIMAASVSDIYLRGFDFYYEAYLPYPSASLRSIVLQDVYLTCHRESLYTILKTCEYLTKFIYVKTDSAYGSSWDLPFPLKIQKGLRNSRQSLRTLCFFCGPVDWYIENNGIFESFGTFKSLENIWLDAWSCGWAVKDNVENELDVESESNFEEESVSPAAAVTLIRTLPSSLRRLHIHGPVDRIYNSLRWLAGHCRDGMMPRLKEIAFDDLESTMATEKLKVMFREAGVRTCSVDMDPISW